MATAPNERMIDWPSRVTLRGGAEADYLGRCDITGRHRLRQFDPKWRGEPTKGPYTVWLLDDYGRCRGDLAPCDQDYVR